MTDVRVCLGCGSRSSNDAQFCPTCGLLLAPAGQAAVQPARFAMPQPPSGAPAAAQVGGAGWYSSPPAGGNAIGGSAVMAARPAGVALLVIVEIVVAVIGLYVALEYAYWANWRFSYDEPVWGVVDGALGLAYASASLTGFSIVTGLWSMRAWTWPVAVRVSFALIGLGLLAVVLWGPDPFALLGIVVQLGVLAYLNLSHVRGLFGRGPATFMQSPG